MPKKIITSALLYANGPLHIGHLVEYIQSDIYVRFLRLIGEDVAWVCADDTHGAPIQINAEKLGITPQELIEKSYEEHKRDFASFNISFDNYYTTHSDETKHFSDLLFNKAKESGYIYKRKISQLYCEHDKMFLPDRYVKGICPKCGAEDQYGDVCEKCGATYKPTELTEPKCSVCGKEPVEKESEHYFFKLSAFSEQLTKWLAEADVQKEIVNSVSQWIKEGLNDWDITRDSPYFGFKIPTEEELYYYVWWDAPIGYIASLDNLTKDGENVWQNSEITHIIGKDIIYFHFLFWPAVLMSAGFNLPKKINVHGFLTVNGEKMSKSRGTFITAEQFAAENDTENLRYYFARLLSKKLSDLDLSQAELRSKVNNELVANIGNFCYRSISFTNKSLGSKISECDKSLSEQVAPLFENVKKSYSELDFREAAKTILQVSDIGNRYFQDKAPWKLVKEDEEKARSVLTACINLVKDLSILIKPILPKMSEEIERQLGLKAQTWENLQVELENCEIKPAEILIQKLEEPKEFPLNLRVAQIKEAKEHPDAEKLLIMQIDLGTEQRQIVAGLKEYYKPEELVGKKIVVVANLKPAKLRGEESQGMLLAAQKDNVLKVVEPDAELGEQVLPQGLTASTEQIKIDKFIKINKLSIKDKKLCYAEHVLRAAGKQIDVDMPDGSEVR